MQRLLRISSLLNRGILAIGAVAGWLFLVLTATIVLDVVSRKLDFQIPGLGSTRLQELEWHLHTALFCAWFGAGYIKNTHVRIDVLTTHMGARANAWIELLGVLGFALPFCLLGLYFSFDFAWEAWTTNESSNVGGGLPARWIPKALIFAGLALLLAATISVGLRLIVYLFGRDQLAPDGIFATVIGQRDQAK